MNHLNRIIIVLFFLSLGISNAVTAQIYINEIMAKNDNVIADENGDFDDWIELYNAGSTAVDLAGYYFSEAAGDPTFWEIPDTDPSATTIPAGGYLIIWADGDPEDGPHHIDFKLSADGQEIYIYAPDGSTLIDELTYPSLSTNTSYGRETDGADDFQIFTAPSPGANNTAGIDSYNAIIVNRINDSSDDAEEPFNENFMTLTDGGINIVNDWSGDQTVGFRFDELNIPPGAIVSRAYIQFTNANTSSSNGPSNLNISGHASGNSATFVGEGQNITSRPLTSATVNWQPEDWAISSESGIKQQTPDLTAVVQEILNQPDWNENSALTFIISGTGTRVAYSYDGDPLRAPQLNLEISVPVTNAPVTNLFINEIAPGGTSHTDETGKFEDWIEIYNGGTEMVNLGGLFLSDNYDNMTKWQISQPYFLAAGDFVVVFTDSDPEEGGLHADFGLSASGEEIVLAQSLNNTIAVIDSVSFSVVPFQTSYGRVTDGADNFVIFGEVTPNESNNGAELGLEKPTINLANGIYQGTQMVSFSHPDPTVTLRYTLDGKEPESFSTAYSTPFSINDNASVKVAAFKSGHVKSTSAVGSYLFNINSNIPTLYINSDPDNFFDDEIGIYVKGTNGVPGFCRTDSVNWNRVEWERPINLGMFLPDGSEAFNVNAGIRISGGCSRIYAQKSFNIYTRRNEYGDEAIDYPIYAGEAREGAVYERIKLRNSGQDYLRTMFRDGLVQTLLWDKMDMDLLGYQPTTLYLNGDFWGIYNIRELFNDEHFENVYGVDKDEIDLLKNPGMPWEEVKRGTDTEYKELFDFASNNDLSVAANYQTVADQFDINQLINYWAFSIYIAKFDWPANNIILWKEKKSGKKWRYGALDHDGSTDNGFAFETTPDFNTLEQVMVPNSTSWPNHSNSTLFLRKLLENEDFRNEFAQRSCSIMELIYSEERTARITDSLQALIEPHIPDQEIRWGEELSIGGNEQNWRGWVANMKGFFVKRPDFYREFMNNQFNLDGTYQLTLNYNEATNGRVVVNSDEMETPYNFINLYYRNIPVRLKAIAEEGHRFSHWLETGDTTEVINFVSGEDAVLTPVFDALVGVEEPEALISYQVFPNPTTGKVNLLASFDQATEATIAVYDLLGKIIYTKKINSVSINEQLDLSGHTAGIYLLNITTEKGTITERLMINR